MFVGKVLDTFEIRGRGLVVVTDTTHEQLPVELRLHVGDPLEFRDQNVVVLRTRAAGVEFSDPYSPRQNFGFSLPREVTKADVPIGCEVFLVTGSAT